MSDKTISNISKTSKLAVAIGAAAIVASFVLFNKSAWGIVLSNFVYFTALSQGTLIIVIAIRIASGHWSSPFFRLGQAVNLSFAPIAGVLLLSVLFLGHNSIHFWAAHPSENIWYQPIFFIVRNILYFAVFYSIAYRIFKTSKLKGSNVNAGIHHKITINGVFLITTFFLGMTVFSWDMSMTLNHGYMDSIYPFRFMAVSLYGGLALIIILMSTARKFLGAGQSYPKEIFQNAATLLFTFSIIWFYTWWAQFFPVWYSHMPEETGPQFYVYANFRTIYLAMMLFSWGIPWFLMLFHRTRNTVGGLTVVAISALTGHWIQRYLETVPAMQKYAHVKAIHILNPLNILFALGLLAALVLVLFRFLDRNPEIIPLGPNHPEREKDLLITKPRGW